MLINNKEVNISQLTPEEVNELTPFRDPESVSYVTDAVVDIEGMNFQPAYDFETIDDETKLTCIYLTAEKGGEDVLERIFAWKDRIVEKYDCEPWMDEYEQPDYNGEFGYEVDDDHWTLIISTNAFNLDYDIRITID